MAMRAAAPQNRRHPGRPAGVCSISALEGFFIVPLPLGKFSCIVLDDLFYHLFDNFVLAGPLTIATATGMERLLLCMDWGLCMAALVTTALKGVLMALLIIEARSFWDGVKRGWWPSGDECKLQVSRLFHHKDQGIEGYFTQTLRAQQKG